MSATGAMVTLCPRDYDAVLFDLDGVLTRTASVHAAAWKRLFDDFLEQRANETGAPFVPFDIQTDYRRYVDGKPRYDGVASFLESRGIELPLGSPDDGPDERSIYGLGHRKDGYFLKHLREHGVEPYEAAVELVRTLRAAGVKTAVVTSSINARPVLQAVGIADLFHARVDGTDVARLGLAGKPAPDAFLEAARRLHVEPERAVVLEDAIAGVEAARAGRFGLVIGVDRIGQSTALRNAGADVVVTHLGQVSIAAEPPPSWFLCYEGFDPAREGIRESLCALGNGYFETRGALPWAAADSVHYPGTYLAGGYNRLRTKVAGRVVENEDLVNLPNWLVLELRIGDGPWLDLRAVELLSYVQKLDLRTGQLLRTIRFEDDHGRRSTLTERRFVSMAHMHLAALELTLSAENWSGPVCVRTAIEGRISNSGARLYRRFNNCHLEPVSGEVFADDCILLVVCTVQSKLRIAEAARTRAWIDGVPVKTPRQRIDAPGYIAQELALDLDEGRTLRLEKVAALTTSRDFASSECAVAARKEIERAAELDALLEAHATAWKQLWRRFDVHIEFKPGTDLRLNMLMLLRLNMFHLLQSASPHSIDLDMGIPARGWTGEAYQGHVFWDELFIFPFLNYRTPEITRSLLMYRYRRLPEARAAAKAAGLAGAMFPWQSGSDGQEETQELNLNPHSERWVPDNTYLQRHVGSAIAWNVWQYFQVTQDIEFMLFHGAELILDIARFWSSLTHFNPERGRYEIHRVMGPDEFHDGYPGAGTPGLRNNAYTNVMAVWVLRRALDVLSLLSEMNRTDLLERVCLPETETARWEEITRRMFVPFHDDGIISQFEGYESLEELDWDAYRARYGNIQRLELILEAEGDTANRYKVSKQADVLMLFYLFSAHELTDLFARLGYPFSTDWIARNVAYYDPRSSHGSTLSRVVHSWVLARSDRTRSMKYFAEALQSDVSDIQQGTTSEGVHLGAMAGTVDLLQRVTTGIEATGDVLRLNPHLPEEMERLDLRIRYRGHSLDLRLTVETLTVRCNERGAAPIQLEVQGQSCRFTGGRTRVFKLGSAVR